MAAVSDSSFKLSGVKKITGCNAYPLQLHPPI